MMKEKSGEACPPSCPAGPRHAVGFRWLSVSGGMLWCALAVSLSAWIEQGWEAHAAREAGLHRASPAELPAPAWRVDINQAPPEELAVLPGIGLRRARSIVEEREKNGPYLNALSLTRIKGIGPATVKRLAPHITVGPEAPRGRPAPAGGP